jgi:predicted carbohydrate-binding protein with CBM5 and CBM33 domain
VFWRRTLAVVATVALAGLASGVPADAHGAMATPVSRAVECGPRGGITASEAACVNAAAATPAGAAAFAAWDNLRVPNVNGRDRQLIPDGKLCSGGLSQFAGLDLARIDWPATTLTAGAKFTFRYLTTIPHKGSFRLYVTKAGYSPTNPLRWSDLETKPFLTVTNPKIVSGAYTFTGRLPAGKSGRHVIYTIWQTTSTPDTYYSCSDVVFGSVRATAVVTPSAVVPSPSQLAAGAADTSPADVDPQPVAAVSHPNPALPIGLSVAAGLAIAAIVLVVQRRRIEAARQAARARRLPY